MASAESDVRQLIRESLEGAIDGFDFAGAEAAENLFLFGVDSFAFIEMIRSIEVALGREFSEPELQELSVMSVPAMARHIAGLTGDGPAPDELPPETPEEQEEREALGAVGVPFVTRMTQVWAAMPKILETKGTLVAVLGASDVQWGFDAVSFDRAAAERRVAVTSFNLAMPVLDGAGAGMFWSAVAGALDKRERRETWALVGLPTIGMAANWIRLDVPWPKVAPLVRGELVRPEYLDLPVPDDGTLYGVPWGWPTRGSVPFEDWLRTDRAALTEKVANRRQILERRRVAVAEVDAGRVPFHPPFVEGVASGLRALQGACDKVFVVVFPRVPTLAACLPPATGPADHLERLRDDLHGRTGASLQVLSAGALGLVEDEFMDHSHLSPLGGAQRFSRMLAELLLSGTRDPRPDDHSPKCSAP